MERNAFVSNLIQQLHEKRVRGLLELRNSAAGHIQLKIDPADRDRFPLVVRAMHDAGYRAVQYLGQSTLVFAWMEGADLRLMRLHLGEKENSNGNGRHAPPSAWEKLRNWLRPPGLCLVLLGPDGVGKSTMMAHLTATLSSLFSGSRIFHWRPRVLAIRHSPNQETGEIWNPHGSPARGASVSVARLLAVFVDTWLGHVLLSKPVLAKNGLVVFDRYLHDVLVDSKRHRYGGPPSLPNFLVDFLPRREFLYLVLDADEQIILQRKRELAPEELRRQRTAYADLAEQTPGAVLLRTDGGLKDSVAAATRHILDHLALRFEREHAVWLPETGSAQERSTEAAPAAVAAQVVLTPSSSSIGERPLA